MNVTSIIARWRTPEGLLFVMAIAMPLAFHTWFALLNNFVIERADFSGREIGILQSLREIPGFLSFAVVLLILFCREQTLALLALIALGLGTLLTGQFSTPMGLYLTTILMSVGFHYFETVNQSLTLQWLPKDRAPIVMGRLLSAGSFASFIALGSIYLLLELGQMKMETIYLLGGGATLVLALIAWTTFPSYANKVEQHKKLFLRKRYWLYYLITFMAGARRQIFVVFAGFLLVEKFAFEVSTIALLYLVNNAINVYVAPQVGKLIGYWGERRALIFEYIGLACVFAAYAIVEVAWLAVLLYLLDHVFFAAAVAIKTYFQKIADPRDIAATAGVAFSINHVAAVVIPVIFGLLWLYSPALVFLAGAAMALVSLGLALLVPRDPKPGNEVIKIRIPGIADPAE